jgi:hypothetical protein
MTTTHVSLALCAVFGLACSAEQPGHQDGQTTAGPGTSDTTTSTEGSTYSFDVSCDEAQECEGDYTITSLADARAVAACETISGDLTVTDPEMTTLHLPCLASVGGDLWVKGGNERLTDLDGLAALSTIGGALTISQNDALLSIDGFASLEEVGVLTVDRNDSLGHINGFGSLLGAEALALTLNASLTSIDGFETLQAIEGDFDLVDNEVLSSFDGLSGLTTVGGFVFLAYQVVSPSPDAIPDLHGLSGLTTVSHSISLHGLNAVTDLDGLASLTSVDTIAIRSNVAMRDLNRLSAVSIGWALALSDLPEVQEIVAPAALPQALEIASMDSVSGLEVFSDIKSLEQLNLTDMAHLKNLDVFANLSGPISRLTLKDNPELANIDGLSDITVVEDYLEIMYNDKLCQSIVHEFLDALEADPTEMFAYENKRGC